MAIGIRRESGVEIIIRMPDFPENQVKSSAKAQLLYCNVVPRRTVPIVVPKPHRIVPLDFLEAIEPYPQVIYRATFGDYNALLELIERKFKYIETITFYFIRHPQAVPRLKEAIRLTGSVIPLQLLRRINREVKSVPDLSTFENVRHHVKSNLNRRMFAAMRLGSQQQTQLPRLEYNSLQVLQA